MWSYPVLDPVSQAYPRAEGRSPTCYSPVRRSCTPEEALPLDLHELSTPPAFVLSQDQTLQQNLANRRGRGLDKNKLAQNPIHRQYHKSDTARHAVEFSKDTRTPSRSYSDRAGATFSCYTVLAAGTRPRQARTATPGSLSLPVVATRKKVHGP